MTKEKTPRTKSQTLSLRLDPKTRFVLEFLSKVYHQSITTVVEGAIRRAGAAARFGEDGAKSWATYWDISEGVRAINLLADKDIPSDFEDDELRNFIQQHIEFFSETYDLSNPDRINVEVLWPKIDDYLDAWRELKRSNPWEVGRVMASDLDSAGVEPPEWPRREKSPPRPIDDDIPF